MLLEGVHEALAAAVTNDEAAHRLRAATATSMAAAGAGGASMSAIGQAVGLTRERVRHVLDERSVG
jgi:hypothetical protein